MVTKFILCFDGQVWSFPMYAVDCISTNAKTKVNIRSDDLMSPQKEIVLKSSIVKHRDPNPCHIQNALRISCSDPEQQKQQKFQNISCRFAYILSLNFY